MTSTTGQSTGARGWRDQSTAGIGPGNHIIIRLDPSRYVRVLERTDQARHFPTIANMNSKVTSSQQESAPGEPRDTEASYHSSCRTLASQKVAIYPGGTGSKGNMSAIAKDIEDEQVTNGALGEPLSTKSKVLETGAAVGQVRSRGSHLSSPSLLHIYSLQYIGPDVAFICFLQVNFIFNTSRQTDAALPISMTELWAHQQYLCAPACVPCVCFGYGSMRRSESLLFAPQRRSVAAFDPLLLTLEEWIQPLRSADIRVPSLPFNSFFELEERNRRRQNCEEKEWTTILTNDR